MNRNPIHVSVTTPCYNEEENIRDVYEQVKTVFDNLENYTYEHIFGDNASTDNTVPILKEIAKRDNNVKIIVNTRNFGQVRSGFHVFLQGRGDIVINVSADLQDPPHLIVDLLEKWEQGYKIVVAVKVGSKESRVMYFIRKGYYKMVGKISETEQISNTTGFGLYDREIANILRSRRDPFPYFRGLMAEIGFERAEVEYVQPKRQKGKTKLSFYALFDIAMQGICNDSKVPLRLATFIGVTVAFVSFLVGIFYFLYKLFFFSQFDAGIAPLVIGLFFFSAVQLMFLGVIGEYIGAIFTQVRDRPLVIEKERINFNTTNSSLEELKD
jgi:glycosyltransferase involved in cell wall biosynthesis